MHVMDLKQKRNPCTIIVIQEHHRDHVHIEFCYDPAATLLQFKVEIHKYLETEYKDSLHHHVYYYCEIGIINEHLSHNDLFELSDDDIMNDCVTPYQTIYLYHPSTSHTIDDTPCIPILDRSCWCLMEVDDPDPKSLAKDDPFFNSINLYFAYCGNKYGVGQGGSEATTRAQLAHLSHSLLIWALRKMDHLWKQKQTQAKFRQYAKLHSFTEQDILDIILLGNKLTDENALDLIEHSPWMASEPKLKAATYVALKEDPSNHTNHFTGCEAIQEEQKAIPDDTYIPDHPLFHVDEQTEEEEPSEPVEPPTDSYDVTFREPIDPPFSNRWPAREGLTLYTYQFVFGLCNEKDLHRFMHDYAKNIGLAAASVDYLMLLCESEMGLARSLSKFAEQT